MEDLLKEAAKAGGGETGSGETAGDLDSRVNVGMDDFTVDVDTFIAMQTGMPSASMPMGENVPPVSNAPPPPQPSFGDPSGELMGLGLSEALPPFEMMEEL